MRIDGREIGPGYSPYIIAEISCNHNGDLATAMKLIQAAKDCGADAVKFQAYEANTITIDSDEPDFIMREGPWKGRNLYALYRQTETPFRMFPALFAYARLMEITPFASVFDPSSVDMLEQLDCPAYKIASMEITDIPLIEYAAKTGKPIIISTGMATEREVAEAMMAAVGNVAVLHCVSGYPTAVQDSNLCELKTLIKYMPQGYRGGVYPVGVSDHSLGSDIPIAATAMGACIIEKHLMLGTEHTEDFDFSLAPIEFENMVRSVRNVWKATQPSTGDVEAPSRQARRSLYVVADIKAGEPFTDQNVRSIRPSYGMEPKKLPWILTQTSAVDLKRGTALKLEHVASLETAY